MTRINKRLGQAIDCTLYLALLTTIIIGWSLS